MCEFMILWTPAAASSTSDAEPLGERLEGAHRGLAVERHRAAEEVVRVEVAEDQVGVGDRRHACRRGRSRRGRAGRRPTAGRP